MGPTPARARLRPTTRNPLRHKGFWRFSYDRTRVRYLTAEVAAPTECLQMSTASVGEGRSRERLPKLTERMVSDAKPAPRGATQYLLRDGECRGFGVRVTEGGLKTFIFEARLLGRNRRFPIGPVDGDLSVEQARGKAYEMRGLVAQGKEPTHAKRELMREPTFRELGDRWLEEHAKLTKRTWPEDERRLKQLFPEWNNRRLSEITKRVVADKRSAIAAERGTYGANRAMALLKAMFRKARDEWGLMRGALPTDGIKAFPEEARERFLSPDEQVRMLKAILEEEHVLWKAFFLVAMFTGARRREITSARWADIDLENGRWTFPRERRKSKKTQVLPVTPVVAAILSRIPRIVGSPFVFPAPTRSGHIEEPKTALSRILARAGIENFTTHDFRHNQASWLAAGGTSTPLLQRVLGHATPAMANRYTHLDVDPVRAVMVRNENAMIALMKEPVVELLPAEHSSP